MKGKSMKSKCGIVTLYGLFNYGNRLQNYASQIVLEDLGFEVYTLVIQDYIHKKNLNEKFKHYIKLALRKNYRKINKNEKRVLKILSILKKIFMSIKYILEI